MVESSDQTEQQTEVLQYRARLAIFYGLDHYQKSDNLQYNTLVRWFAGTNDSSTKRLIFQVSFEFIFLFFYKFTKIKIKRIECHSMNDLGL